MVANIIISPPGSEVPSTNLGLESPSPDFFLQVAVLGTRMGGQWPMLLGSETR